MLTEFRIYERSTLITDITYSDRDIKRESLCKYARKKDLYVHIAPKKYTPNE